MTKGRNKSVMPHTVFILHVEAVTFTVFWFFCTYFRVSLLYVFLGFAHGDFSCPMLAVIPSLLH